MKAIRLTLLLLLCLFSQKSFSAEEYLFRKFDSRYSLHDNTVRNVLELPNGEMCIQTLTMLHIFDGASVVSHKYDLNKIPYAEYNAMKNIYCDSKNRVWLKNRDNIWAFDLTKEKFIYNIDSLARDFTKGGCAVENIFIIDRSKYFTFDKSKRALHFYDDNSGEKFQTALPEILGDPLEITQAGDDYWILCSNENLAQFNKTSQCFVYIEQSLFEASSDENRYYMTSDDQGKLWIIMDHRLICYNPKEYKILSEVELTIDDSDIFTSITNDHKGSVWIGTARSGIHIINTQTLEESQIPYLDVVDGTRLVHNTDIAQLYTDSKGGVWVATDAEGLLYHHEDIVHFNVVNNLSLSKGSMRDVNIKCMIEEKDGTILLGTIDGLYSYNPTDNSVKEVYPQIMKMLRRGNFSCTGLFRDRDDRIWVGTFQNGFFCIDGDNIRHFYDNNMPAVDDSYINSTTNVNSARSFFQAYNGDIYVSVYRGLGLIDEPSGKVNLIDLGTSSNLSIIRGVTQLSDDQHIIYADNGVSIYHDQSEESESPQTTYSITPLLDNGYDVHVDPKGWTWIATIDGLVIYDQESNRIRRLTQNDGLGGNKVFGLAADRRGAIWAATSAGVSVVIPSADGNFDNLMVVNFTAQDGISNTSFFYASALHSSGERIYFGSSDGVITIDPEKLIQQGTLENNLSVETTLRDKSGNIIPYNKRNNTLSTKIGETTNLTLSEDVYSISFDFKAMNFINPSQTKFLYKLENFDYDWITIDGEKMEAKASYAHMRPGEYTLLVKSACNGGMWTSQSAKIAITILPPWWTSQAAILVYLLILTVSVYLIANRYTRRKYAQTLRLQEIENQHRKEELEATKQSFFINVSHELRTPLSLILLPLESIINKVDPSDQNLKAQLLTMHRNAKNLKALVDNLLSFKKLDMSCEVLNPTMGDMQLFVHSTYNSFSDAANAKNITFTFISQEDRLYASFDRAMMQKVLNNLLSNAMKFTPSGGSVTLSLKKVEGKEQQPKVEIQVTDTGIGIPSRDLNAIFDRFYQASNNTNLSGSGIGLSLAKSYVALHGGEIEVKSTLEQGSTFTILIPMDKYLDNESVDEGQADEAEIEESEANTEPTSENRYKILVVDDNDDFRDYLARELSEEFDVVTAENGEQGIKIAQEAMPDLITSDVMMPLKDGYELTQTLKANFETSHIPIILLTVQSSDENRLSGYEVGADAYISKPFNWGVLHARIHNLIEDRKGRSKKFIDQKDDEIDTLKLTALDKKFILKAIESIERNLDNTEYSVEVMCEDLAMSRMSIYRKFKSIMGQTPADFIRNIRLKRAAQWMEQGDRSEYLLYEVANKFGFNTPKYFTKYFKERYSQTPSQYIARFKEKDNL